MTMTVFVMYIKEYERHSWQRQIVSGSNYTNFSTPPPPSTPDHAGKCDHNVNENKKSE